MDEHQTTPVSPTPTYVTSVPSSTITPSNQALPGFPPFEQSQQLCKELEYIHGTDEPSYLHSHTKAQRLPDAPSVSLDSRSMIAYSLQDLDTPGLNKLNHKLWWCGANPIVKTLSHQLTFERRIVVTEDPSLHLVLSENRIIYIKPLPAYLCSHAFWEYLLDPRNHSISPEERARLTSTSLGFLRTYAQLITHRSDHTIALCHGLLPQGDTVTFESLVAFTSAFTALPFTAVSPRWRYGELLLEALNFHSGLFLHRYHFNRFESNYGVYFQRFFPVTLFLFASFSVILSAMQVILTGRQMRLGSEGPSQRMKKLISIFEWFGTEAIGWALALGLMFLVWWIVMATLEGWKMRGVKEQHKKIWKGDERSSA
ncbi:uncharacterized protein N0V89_006035 [Didymosphaeria variabile]|uniref:Uncharacterized protein n=1 Tax=Didymosphaeria variabile TaxID=1932322 RepID=A0A9W8XM51_9PLEO|nr:uncharacterized protein N0V89_006035 [Didymosphaeria variabile]KAJ4354301.1 hypothetical protein N0V89_006035 [Didymosphaeria variabile]